MKITEAADVLRQLLSGVDPDTGEVLPEDHLLRTQTVREALMTALQGLGSQRDGSVPVNRSGRLNAGRPWTPEDLEDLRQLYESGTPIEEIARLTHRRARGVRLQLNLMAGGGPGRHERVEIPDVINAEFLDAMASARRRSGPAHRERSRAAEEGAAPADAEPATSVPDRRGRPWSAQDDADLAWLFRKSQTFPEIAAALGRSAYAVGLRLQKLGLLPDENDPDNMNRPWTDGEVGVLHGLALRGLSAADIATRMNRTEAAVSARMFYLGLGASALALFPEGMPARPQEREAAIPVAEDPQASRSGGDGSYAVPVWTREELHALRRLYEGGMPVQEIAREMGRGEKGVRLQLNLMAGGSRRLEGRLNVPDVYSPGALPPLNSDQVSLLPENAGQPWTPEQEEQLAEMYAAGRSIREMSRAMNRTPGGIRARLRHCGLDPDALASPRQEAEPPRQAPAPVPEKVAAAISPSRRWTPEEDAYLRRAWAEGTPLEKIARRTGRKDRLVRCRLVFLGAADRSLLGGPEVPPEMAHQGLPWYPEEIETLYRLAREGCSVTQMAATLRRSEDVVRNRLDILGLQEDGRT